MRRTQWVSIRSALLFLAAVALTGPLPGQGKRPLSFVDVMKFEDIQNPSLSEDGRWVAYGVAPDRGDGKAIVQSTSGQPVYTLERGTRPAFSKDGNWVAATIQPGFVEAEKARSAKKEAPRPGLGLLNVQAGTWKKFERVDKFEFSEDARWIAFLRFPEEKPESKPESGSETADEKGKKKEPVGNPLVMLDLKADESREILYVTGFAFSPDARFLAYSKQSADGKGNGVYLRELHRDPDAEQSIAQKDGSRHTGLAWSRQAGHLAYLEGVPSKPGDEDISVAATLWWWDSARGSLKQVEPQAADGWRIPLKNQLRWTRDGERLFFGRKPAPGGPAAANNEGSPKESQDLYNLETILEKKELDVWHWKDPRIVTQQKEIWPRVKDQVYRAVYHAGSGNSVQLADESVPQVEPVENKTRALGLSDVPYLREITWDGNYQDIYAVDLRNGSKKKVVDRLSGRPSLSPAGRFVAYYRDRNWHLFDSEKGTTRNLTEGLGIPFYDEDHDTPDQPGGYGVAGWIEGDRAVLIYDKFDIWQFPTDSKSPLNLTRGVGREERRIFRLLRTDPEQEFLAPQEPLLLSSYHDLEKNWGFYAAQAGRSGVERLLEEKKRFTFLQKARRSDTVLYTRESYAEFPDLWVADTRLQSPRRVSEVNPRMREFLWGEPELISWSSMDGVPLQGVLIKPGDYQPGKRYPVIVYYYELFSQRLYEFNQPVVNHRPCFPLYTSNGYAIFLPDVRFELGRPGFSATKCIIPGVQKLIDMGIADPKGIGLHGHSWSGYQTAFVITQTDMFAAAVAGAPVSNMTSAYSGIRWESGLARQFQYEKGQSRIGGTLWDSLQRYIENSPVFYADRIRTPLLIEFGDEDGAVPWYQGIELYLAMRRLGKDCVFLQYHGEPHHLRKYPNKLDYAMKMMEYFDHYLKGAPAPAWIDEGVAYRGK